MQCASECLGAAISLAAAALLSFLACICILLRRCWCRRQHRASVDAAMADLEKHMAVPTSRHNSITPHQHHHDDLLLDYYFSSANHLMPFDPTTPWSENTILLPTIISRALDVHTTTDGALPQTVYFNAENATTTLHLARPIPLPRDSDDNIDNDDNVTYCAKVHINQCSDSAQVVVGLISRPHPHNMLPGHLDTPGVVGVGYASDGRLHLHGTPCLYGPPFGAGDEVTMAYRPRDGYVAFWRGDEELGMASYGVGLGQAVWVAVGVTGPARLAVQCEMRREETRMTRIIPRTAA